MCQDRDGMEWDLETQCVQVLAIGSKAEALNLPKF